MAIAAKPKRDQKDIKSSDAEKIAAAFIDGAAPSREPEVKKNKKEPVLLRFDDQTLRQIDQDAKRLGLSRAAWVRMVVAERLG